MGKIRKKDPKTKNRNALRMKLNRLGIDSSGLVANFLLDAFVIHNGKLNKEGAVARGIIKDRKAKNEKGEWKSEWEVWRLQLEKADVLLSELVDNGSAKKWRRYYAGANLLEYVNREKSLTVELASRRQVDAVGDEVEKLKAEVAIWRRAVENVIQEYDPPVDEDKIEKALTGQRLPI